jgi:hypothetical protein
MAAATTSLERMAGGPMGDYFAGLATAIRPAMTMRLIASRNTTATTNLAFVSTKRMVTHAASPRHSTARWGRLGPGKRIVLMKS